MNELTDKKRIIIYDSVPFFIPFFEKRGLKVFPTLRKVSLLSKMCRRISIKFGIFKNYWFGGWKNFLNDVEEVIIFASNEPSPINLILQQSGVKVIYWYWNPVFKVRRPEQISNLCEKWSFDKKDCLKYSLKYNSTFFFKDITLPEEEICFDILFLGLDKGRGEALKMIEKSFLDIDLNPYFYIVDEKTKSKDYPPVGYQEYLRLVSKSKAILDFLQDGQDGMTLRPMEALFFNKKLVTNDISIKEEDFYHPDNIFIIGLDHISNIKKFLELPVAVISKEIFDRYDVSDWVKRFSEEGEME